MEEHPENITAQVCSHDFQAKFIFSIILPRRHPFLSSALVISDFSQDASNIKSAEAKFTGIAQPPKGTISAEADHLASVNAKASIPAAGANTAAATTGDKKT